MTKKKSLADALQVLDRAQASSIAESARTLANASDQRLEGQAPSRRGKKALIGYFDPSVSKQLKQLALDEDSSIQKLLGEAIDLLFASRGKPLIAQTPES